MKILLVSHQLDFSGAPIALLQMARMLKMLGHETVMHSLSDGPLKQAFLNADCLTFDPEGTYVDFDLFIANTVVSVPFVINLDPGAEKTIAWIHEAEYFFNILKMKPADLKLQHLKFAVFPSKFQIEEFRPIIKDARLKQLKNWVEKPVPVSDERSTSSYFVVTGAWETRKNQARLLELLSQGPPIPEQIHFLGASFFKRRFLQNFEIFMHIFAFNGVRYLGKCEPKKAKEVIGGAAGLISVSLSETQNLTAIEAMVRRVPVLLSDIPAHQELKEAIPDVILFDLKDPKSFFSGLEQLRALSNDNQLKIRIQNDAIKAFGDDAFRRNLTEVIASATARRVTI